MSTRQKRPCVKAYGELRLRLRLEAVYGPWGLVSSTI